MKGIPQHIFPTAFSSCPSAPLSIYAIVYKVLGRSSSFHFHNSKIVLETIYLRLGLEPCGKDSNPARIHGAWFQDPVKLRFLMSHHRKNSVREKVISKKWFYSDAERSTLYRHSVGHHRERVQLTLTFIAISEACSWPHAL